MNSNDQNHDTGHSTRNGWTIAVIVVVAIVSWLLYSDARDKAEYKEALKVTGARVECRAEAKREGWTEAEADCDKLGTPGYDISTDSYYNMYKLRTGAE